MLECGVHILNAELIAEMLLNKIYVRIHMFAK